MASAAGLGFGISDSFDSADGSESERRLPHAYDPDFDRDSEGSVQVVQSEARRPSSEESANGEFASVEDILEGAQPGNETNGRTTQYIKPGGFSQANEDFNSLGPDEVKEVAPGVRVGQLPDGRKVVVRPNSSHGTPTLEIQAGRRRIKVRYDE